MNTHEFIRDPQRVHACLQELSDGRLIALRECKIYAPARFLERGLMELGVDNYISGIYAIVVEDKYYGVSLVNAMIKIEPTDILKIKIKGEEYYEFTFESGATVISSLNLVQNDILVYKIYDEIISKGKIPWYLNYEDLGHIFDSAKYHAGANIGTQSEVTELIVSLIARDPTDKVKYYRTIIDSPEDLKTKIPVFIPLRSVSYSATNTTNKLAGSYFNTGVTSALVNPSERTERIEGILRR